MKIEGKTNLITGEVGVSFSFDSYPELFNALKSLFKKGDNDFLGTEFYEYIESSFNIILQDLIIDDSPSQFGWGHSYLNILKDIYPDNTPTVSLDRASLTHTAWNIDCLKILFDKTLDLKIRLYLNKLFEKISDLYLEPRYSKEFFGAGGNLTHSQTGLIPAISLRHTASLIRSYAILNIHSDRIFRKHSLKCV